MEDTESFIKNIQLYYIMCAFQISLCSEHAGIHYAPIIGFENRVPMQRTILYGIKLSYQAK